MSKESDSQTYKNSNNSLSMCKPSFKVLAIIVPEKTVTQKQILQNYGLQSYVMTELRTDQI